MIVDVLLWLLVIVALLQPTKVRLYAASLFAGFAMLHTLLLGSLSGIAYYGSAAAVDLGVVWAIDRIKSPSRILLILQFISIISIVLNAAGWAIWRLYLPPDIYNAAFGVLYFMALIVLLQKDRTDVGCDSMGSWHPGIRFHTSNRSAHLHSHDGKI